VKLIDFEGACHLVEDHVELGNAYGTLPYIAPEVVVVATFMGFFIMHLFFLFYHPVSIMHFFIMHLFHHTVK
jgi:serine/threonine protein kinase